MTHDYPIRTGAAPTGNPESYGDIAAIRALLDATDPTAIAAAGDAYKAASRNLGALRDLVTRASKTLAEVWEDEAATATQQTLRKLQAGADNLATATGRMGAALDWYGAEILPWYVSHKPGTGFIKDGGDDEYAREHMRRLNRRIAEAWSRLPESVSQEPVRGTITPPTSPVSASPTGSGHWPEEPAGVSPGGTGTDGSGHRPSGPQGSHFDHAGFSDGQGGSRDVRGPDGRPGALPGIGGIGSDAGSSGNETDLAGLGSTNPTNAQSTFGGPGGRLGPPGPAQFTSPGGPAPVLGGGAGAPPGLPGPLGTRPAPLSGPGPASGGRPGALPGRGNATGGFPVGGPGPGSGAGGTGRSGARGVSPSPLGGVGASAGGRRQEERSRKYWLPEDQETWGAEEAVASVIGAVPATESEADDDTQLADERAETWGVEPTFEHVIGHPSLHAATPDPSSDEHEGRPSSCACDCSCGGSEDDAPSKRTGKAEEQKNQGPPPRLEASPILRGE